MVKNLQKQCFDTKFLFLIKKKKYLNFSNICPTLVSQLAKILHNMYWNYLIYCQCSRPRFLVKILVANWLPYFFFSSQWKCLVAFIWVAKSQFCLFSSQWKFLVARNLRFVVKSARNLKILIPEIESPWWQIYFLPPPFVITNT